ncbi:uncharacterized protein LOC135472548 [Liolophura sinensis]|uniref:uncharacterized protein LOC135472548 n=1 Tax=Liolophura sinensis TaxID=3198878 RepID=UPI003158EC8E
MVIEAGDNDDIQEPQDPQEPGMGMEMMMETEEDEGKTEETGETGGEVNAAMSAALTAAVTAADDATADDATTAATATPSIPDVPVEKVEKVEKAEPLNPELETALTALLWQAYDVALQPHLLKLQRDVYGQQSTNTASDPSPPRPPLLENRELALSIVDEARMRYLKEGTVLVKFMRQARKTASLPWAVEKSVKDQLRQFLNETPINKSNPAFAQMYVEYLMTANNLSAPDEQPTIRPNNQANQPNQATQTTQATMTDSVQRRNGKTG